MGIATDGAPSMVGRQRGLSGRVSAELACRNLPQIIWAHCIVHQESLCAKAITLNHVMKVVVPTINFIRSRDLNHRQFQDFFRGLDADFGDVIYHSEVRWMSRGKTLERFWHLRDEIRDFMEAKGREVSELTNSSWLNDLAFLVDIAHSLSI